MEVIYWIIGAIVLAIGGGITYLVRSARRKDARDKLIEAQESKTEKTVHDESTQTDIKKSSLIPDKNPQTVVNVPPLSEQKKVLDEKKEPPEFLPIEDKSNLPAQAKPVQGNQPDVLVKEKTPKNYLEVCPLPRQLSQDLDLGELGKTPIIIQDDFKPTGRMEAVHMTREMFVPRVRFMPEAFAEIRESILSNPRNEIRGFGTVFVNGNDPEIILIKDIYIPKQNVTGVNVKLPPNAMNELLAEISSSYEKSEDGDEALDHLNCSWHSHVDLPVDPSDDDRKEVRQAIFVTDRDGNLLDEKGRIIPLDPNGNIIHNSLFPRMPVPTRDIYVDCIFNLKGDANISVYYPREFRAYHNVRYSIACTVPADILAKRRNDRSQKIFKNQSPFGFSK